MLLNPPPFVKMLSCGYDRIHQTFIQETSMQRKSSFNSSHIMYRSEELVSAASNRYRITVQVANRAKRRRYEELENFDDPTMKPVIRAIIEMSDELTQPEIIGD